MNSNAQAIDIASFFIRKGVSPLKLQKLLYYSQLWFYVKYKENLFTDKIRAWIYGPVIHAVWDTFRYMKRSDIIPISRTKDIQYNDCVSNHLEEIWNAYGHLSGSDLVDLTHSDLPWKNSRKGLLNDQPSSNEVVIDDYTTNQYVLDANNKIPFVQSFNTFGHYSNS